MPFPTSGLIAYWKLDEAIGTRVDSAAGGLGAHSLTEFGGTTGSATGIINLGASFTGGSNFLLAANAADFEPANLTSWTVAGWLKPIDGGSGIIGEMNLVSLNRNTGDNAYVVGYGTDFSTNAFQFTIFDSGNNEHDFAASTFGAATPGTLYFIVAWYDAVAGQVGISVNDVANTYSYSSGFTTYGIFNVGQDFNFVWGENGVVDEVGFWNRALTPTERTTLYNGGAGLTYSASPPPPPPPPPPAPYAHAIQELNILVDPSEAALLTDDGLFGQSPPGEYWNAATGQLDPQTGLYIRRGGTGINALNITPTTAAPFSWRTGASINTAVAITEVQFNPIGTASAPTQIQTGTLMILSICVKDPTNAGFNLTVGASDISDDLGTAYQFVRSVDLAGDVLGKFYVFYGIAPGITVGQTNLTISPPFDNSDGDQIIVEVSLVGYLGSNNTLAASISASGQGDTKDGSLTMTPGILTTAGPGALIYAAYITGAQAFEGGAGAVAFEVVTPGPGVGAGVRATTTGDVGEEGGFGGYQTDLLSSSVNTAPTLQLIYTQPSDTDVELFWSAIGVAFN